MFYWVLGIFDADDILVSSGSVALRLIGPGFILSSVAVVASGVYESLGKGRTSLMISLMRQVIFMIPLSYLLSRFMGPRGVWISFPISEALTLVFSSIVLHGLYGKTLLD